MRALGVLDGLLQSQRGDLFPWVPVLFGVGIGLFFSLRFEPDLAHYLWGAGPGCVALAMLWRGDQQDAVVFLGWVLLLVTLGFATAGLRAHSVGAPVLQYRSYGAVEGRVIAIDRSARDRLRITLDQPFLDRIPPAQTPARLRLSLPDGAAVPRIGDRVMTTAHLMPPQGPVEPHGFDFRRHAWFQQLGAVGYTRVPVLIINRGPRDLPVEQLRQKLSTGIRSQMPVATGGFAVAITTGDRSAIPQAALEALRASNLAHLLAISGLHMGLLAGVVFGGLRLLLALAPAVAQRIDTKKLAAVGALLAASAYLLLSGMQVASTRAYIMVAMMLGAVLLDRRALSLRAVALAAIVILLLRPESLLSPGFQMSFAATTALIVIFGSLRDRLSPTGPRWLRLVTGLVLSSLIAGLATAPFGAAHFNMISHYGLLANVLAVPVMGALVVPAAVLALCLAPVGASWIGLTLMDLGISWILFVANWVAALDGAQGAVPMPPAPVLPLVAFGGLLLGLWRGRLRLLGVPVLIGGAMIWYGNPRPAVLAAPNGGIVGVLTAEGRALSRAKGHGYAAERWTENDGSLQTQEEGAQLWPLIAGPEAPGKSVTAYLAATDQRLTHVMGKAAAEAMTECAADEVIISAKPVAPVGGCLVFDEDALHRMGSVQMDAEGRWTSAQDVVGTRLWSRDPVKSRSSH
ncbi:ComEC/Rec2 family competence protein [Phaeobacter gallaeciensis]|uniref:ComEC/Rec2-related protein n=1 Tax=Phaeobacter gallaeciensis TaxID=60890 RepID=A0AAC9Z8Z0_9RHOB|nr:ComEC/Rec2 family competence protein [Phaeobacter gallaeciensis]AHD09407.1 ComEC/Rec2-related protein [Phaeobacter gallaeciensis DSM 26640]ATE92670.1 ComEC/Rec2-related protein [Phaeobacter gallaeciensis]ATE97508.1 ComEC/Rec2-related protein [Phaeobacter gallaeciensis]ATF01335.1 ComEC/Rec2-related protein [Phaeobacter gallaeciensis]ATF05715.1 ComEC/Rec2-related protein [Phaeobacter gallaeciensis]